VVTNVISRPSSVVAKLSANIKFHKYKRLHEGHHFTPMAMEVHNAFGHDMNFFIREYAHIFHDRRLGSHLSLPFCIPFFKEHVNIAFQLALVFAIDKKITLARDACFKSSIIIKSHNLHVSNIKGAVGNSFLPQVG
jgi:hypothetical protein